MKKMFFDKYTIFNLSNFQPQHILNTADSAYFVKSAPCIRLILWGYITDKSEMCL